LILRQRRRGGEGERDQRNSERKSAQSLVQP
jgi:hypothetical protein